MKQNACHNFNTLPDREVQEDQLFNFLHLLPLGALPERGDDDDEVL
jgi:hypothetical protein